MEVYCTAPYWVKTGGVQMEARGRGEDKFEDTQLFISKIYGLWAEGSRGKRRRQVWELVVEFAPCYLTPGVENPGGQFLIQLVHSGAQYVKSDYCTYLESQKLQVENSKEYVILHRWLRVVCVISTYLPSGHEYSIIIQDRLGKLVPSKAHSKRGVVSTYFALLLR